MMDKQTCTECGGLLTDDTWYPSYRQRGQRRCKACCKKRLSDWRKANPEKCRLFSEIGNRRGGRLYMGDNKECSSFLGVYYAEYVLSVAFPEVVRMPTNNPGFDFMCNMGMVDAKSSCINTTKTGAERWIFVIKKNKIPDFFLLLAFDNRYNLNPMHLWMIPSHVINSNVSVSVSPSTLGKWAQYEVSTNKLLQCNDMMKAEFDARMHHITKEPSQ